MKDLDRSGSSARQAGRSKDDSGGDNKSDSWIEGKEASYRGARRRESRWDESENAKRIWHGNKEERMAQGQRFRGGREWGDMGNDIPDDGRDGDRREDYHSRRVKDVVESNIEEVENWDRSGDMRQDHRDDEEKVVDRRKSSKDRDDIVEGRGRPIPKLQDDDDDYGDKSRLKDELYWEEPDDRRRGWKSSKMGRGVKRSWSPNLRRRGRVEQDDFDREWSDDRRDERGFRREYDRDRDRFTDREVDFQWERDREFRSRELFREEGDFFRDRTREREDSERWKHRQRDRQKEKEDDAEYNYERDGWEVPRREKEKAERDYKSGEDRKDKDQTDALKSPQSSGIISDTLERAGGSSNVSIDVVRDRGFGSGSPFLSRRGDGGPPADFHPSNGDADWMGDDRHRQAESEYQDRNYFEEENPAGLDQSFGRSRAGDGSAPFNVHSGRGRGPKGSPGQRGRGGGDGRPPFAGSQGSGMMMRGVQQSGIAIAAVSLP